MAIANDPPPLAGFPDLGPDGAQVWRRFGDRRHVSQLLSAQVCAHSPAGSGAPSHLELRHSLQVLGCSAGGRPLPPPGLIAPDNSGPGLRPTASGCRPRPLVVRGSGQWAGPPHPPLLGVILGPSTRPNPALQRAEFFRIFGACGAAPRGGGGAPPTTLILLRNQRSSAPACRGRATRTAGGRRDRLRACLGHPGAKKSKKILFFFEEGCVCFGVDEWGCGNRLRRCGRRRRAGPPPPPMAELCEARGGALPGPVPQTGTLPGAGRVSTYGGPRATLRGVGPRLALANGLPLSASATPLRGTAVPCFEGGALPHGYVPPTSAEEALAGPVAAMLPNRTGPCLACCAW